MEIIQTRKHKKKVRSMQSGHKSKTKSVSPAIPLIGKILRVCLASQRPKQSNWATDREDNH